MKQNQYFYFAKLLKRLNKLLLLFGIIVLQTSLANPESGVATFGSATINTSEHQVDIIQHTDRVIIDWQNFNIAVNEQTNFFQPDSNSIAVNRIHSNIASSIYGQLHANGKLILINQNGFFFGKDAKVDVNGLLATTANFSDDQFIQNDQLQQEEFNENSTQQLLVFDQPGSKNSKIVNSGEIRATNGLLGFVAPTVLNSGLIIAKANKVHLGSGEIFTLDLYGDNLLNIAVSKDLDSQLVSNQGKVIADGNKIILTAAAGEEIIKSLIINTGALQAKSVSNRNGEVIIMAEGSNAVPKNVSELKGLKGGQSKVIINGIIDVTGFSEDESGGKVKILGDHIELVENAAIDASGCSGFYKTTVGSDRSAARDGSAGGEVLIGGNYLGQGELPTAITVNVGPLVKIYADSLEKGDAGRIIVWSDGVTNFSGTVYSRGLGELKTNSYGDGGFVEISGSKDLILGSNYSVNLYSNRGLLGTLFLDPSSVTIDSTFISTNNIANIIVAADQIIFDLGNNSYNIGNDFNFSITANSSILVNTGGSISTNRVTTNGNITIDSSHAIGALVDLNAINFTAQNGAVITINTAGLTTLGNIQAGSLLVHAVGNNSNIVIPSSKQITVTESSNPLILATDGAFINNNQVGSNPFNLTATGARWLIYSGNYYNNVGNKKTHIGNYTPLYEQVYNAAALPTQTGNLLIYAVSKNLTGSYDNKTVLVPSGYSKKLVTVPNIVLAGTDAINYKLVNSNNTAQTTVQGYVGQITPKELVVAIDVTKKITKTYDSTTSAQLSDQNYVLYDVVPNDIVGLTNHTSGVYEHSYADTYTNSILINGQANATPVNYQKVSVNGIGLTGQDYINYHLNSANLTAEKVGCINPVNISVSLKGSVSKTYDRTTTIDPHLLDRSNNFTITPAILSADTANVGLNFSEVDYHDKNIGNNKAIVVADLSLTGTAAGNYQLTTQEATGNIGTINPKPINVTLTNNNGNDIVRKNYDGGTAAVVHRSNYSLNGSNQNDDLFLNNK